MIMMIMILLLLLIIIIIIIMIIIIIIIITISFSFNFVSFVYLCSLISYYMNRHLTWSNIQHSSACINIHATSTDIQHGCQNRLIRALWQENHGPWPPMLLIFQKSDSKENYYLSNKLIATIYWPSFTAHVDNKQLVRQQTDLSCVK